MSRLTFKRLTALTFALAIVLGTTPAWAGAIKGDPSGSSGGSPSNWSQNDDEPGNSPNGDPDNPTVDGPVESSTISPFDGGFESADSSAGASEWSVMHQWLTGLLQLIWGG